jgi:hypothetical protein
MEIPIISALARIQLHIPLPGPPSGQGSLRYGRRGAEFPGGGGGGVGLVGR